MDRLHQIIVSERAKAQSNAEFIAQNRPKHFRNDKHAARPLKRKEINTMIHPSYTELIEAINTNSEEDDTTMS